ncbi:MAG TPA: hypothetical protein PL048_10225, partial [Leptospiraceae bacterium]|nr:hypothetical protein [Leptospiraceae bacterium]
MRLALIEFCITHLSLYCREDPQFRYESNLYLEKNQFSTIKKKTEVEIDLFLASKNATLWPPVKETFDQCLAASIQELDPKNVVMTPFHGGEQFIRLEIIQCVNQKIEEVVRKQISEVLGENDQTQYDTY